ncbi:MAG: PEGA domain-containing protein [Lentisphaerae bacterium]|nr:PEGA domain-containing protein [Lentisphaerota bacterium]
MPKRQVGTGKQTLCLLVLPTAIWLLTGCDAKRTVTVETSPPGAAIWAGDDIIGPAPQKVTVPAEGDVHLTVYHPGFESASATIAASALPPERRTTITLRRQRPLSLTCRSSPAGAALFLNGEFRGTTPVELADLTPGAAEITFRMEGREPVSKTVALTPDNPTQTVNATLKSVTEGYYLQQIQTTPDELPNYVDLAHHYMLEKRFDDAMRILKGGIDIAFKNPHLSASRLWSEVGRVTERQYDYGDADDVKKARRLLRDMLGKVVKADAGGEQRLYLLTSYVVVLDSLSERRKAQQYFEKAWSEFPRNKHLERMRRKYRFSIY